MFFLYSSSILPVFFVDKNDLGERIVKKEYINPGALPCI
jgi:hypothetical protein